MESYGQPSLNRGVRPKQLREEMNIDFRRVSDPCITSSSSSSSSSPSSSKGYPAPRSRSQNTRQNRPQKSRSRSQNNYDLYFQEVVPMELRSPQRPVKQSALFEEIVAEERVRPHLEPYVAKWSPEAVKAFREAQRSLKQRGNLEIVPVSQKEIRKDVRRIKNSEGTQKQQQAKQDLRRAEYLNGSLPREIPTINAISRSQVRGDVRRADKTLEADEIREMAQQVRRDLSRGDNFTNTHPLRVVSTTVPVAQQNFRRTDGLVDVPLPAGTPVVVPICAPPPPIIGRPYSDSSSSDDLCDNCDCSQCCAPMDRCCGDCENILCCGGCCGLGALCESCSSSSGNCCGSCDGGYSCSIPGICEFLAFTFFLTAMILTVAPYQGGPQFACILFGTILGWVSPFIIYFTKLCFAAHQLNVCYRIYVCVHLSLAVVFGFIATVLASDQSINGSLRSTNIAIAVFSGLGTAALIVDFAYNVTAYFS